MKLRFTKMQGAGNDFVVVDATKAPFCLSPRELTLLTDRRFGVGCDQVLVVERPTLPETDFKYRIINADGSEVEMCGNGARCFVKFVIEKGLTKKRKIVCETKAGLITPEMLDNGYVRVHMGCPHFKEEEIPMNAQYADDRTVHNDGRYAVRINKKMLWFSATSMGNPHATFVVDDVQVAPVNAVGSLLQHHALFPNRVNVGFMQVMSRNAVKLRVYERGAGETLACGTGASAAVVTGIRRGLLDEKVDVFMAGGKLTIEWAGKASDPVYLSGPAVSVYSGEIDFASCLQKV